LLRLIPMPRYRSTGGESAFFAQDVAGCALKPSEGRPGMKIEFVSG
jgi:hypothetical protein